MVKLKKKDQFLTGGDAAVELVNSLLDTRAGWTVPLVGTEKAGHVAQN